MRKCCLKLQEHKTQLDNRVMRKQHANHDQNSSIVVNQRPADAWIIIMTHILRCWSSALLI